MRRKKSETRSRATDIIWCSMGIGVYLNRKIFPFPLNVLRYVGCKYPSVCVAGLTALSLSLIYISFPYIC